MMTHAAHLAGPIPPPWPDQRAATEREQADHGRIASAEQIAMPWPVVARPEQELRA